jgi:hypothetical protein
MAAVGLLLAKRNGQSLWPLALLISHSPASTRPPKVSRSSVPGREAFDHGHGHRCTGGGRNLGRNDFQVDARLLRRGLLENGYRELEISGDHAVMVEVLPPIHKDPFDRILVAQAVAEGILLPTADPLVAQYPGPRAQNFMQNHGEIPNESLA